jgi:opacity protein-like surface antigen
MPRNNSPSDRCAGRSLRKISLKSTRARLGLVAIIAVMLRGVPALAEEQAGTHSIEIFGGELFGDNLTHAPVSGSTPRVNDNATFGARYNYNITDMWGIQVSGGYSPTRAARVASGNDNLGITTVDLDAVWNITPQYPIVAYAFAGGGYAWANLNRPIEGVINGRSVVITDCNGFTANVGIGAKYYMTNHVFIDLQARYRYLNRLVNNSNQNLNMAEATLGVGWRF